MDRDHTNEYVIEQARQYLFKEERQEEQRTGKLLKGYTHLHALSEEYRRRKLSWFYKVASTPTDNPIYRLTFQSASQLRPKILMPRRVGRPKQKWVNSCLRDIWQLIRVDPLSTFDPNNDLQLTAIRAHSEDMVHGRSAKRLLYSDGNDRWAHMIDPLDPEQEDPDQQAFDAEMEAELRAPSPEPEEAQQLLEEDFYDPAMDDPELQFGSNFDEEFEPAQRASSPARPARPLQFAAASSSTGLPQAPVPLPPQVVEELIEIAATPPRSRPPKQSTAHLDPLQDPPETPLSPPWKLRSPIPSLRHRIHSPRSPTPW